MAKASIILVSDASVQKSGQSGFAWVIANKTTPIWRGMGLAPGPVDDMHSGRAEAFGLLAAFIFLEYYLSCFDHQVPPTKIRCFCDNLGVITTLTNMQDTTIARPNDTTADDRDIFLEIMATVSRCQNISFQYLHVKGHQDNDPKRHLTIPEQHNVDCDRLAKQYVKSATSTSTDLDNPEFPAAQPYLIIEDHVVCRKHLSTLRHVAATPEYYDYLRRRFNWTTADLRNIQWTTLNRTLQMFNRNDQRRIILFIHDKLPLWSSKFHPHLGSTLCPSCQREPEDYWHFFGM